MVRAQKSVADLGPIGIMHEAGRLFSTHATQFLLFQLTLVLPSTILALTLDLVISESNTFPASPLDSSGNAYHLSGSTSMAGLSNCSYMFIIPALRLVGMTFFSALVNQVCQSLWVPSTLYSMRLSYAGKSVSFLNVMHEMPRLWKRLVASVLSAQILLLVYCIAFLNAGLDFIFLTAFHLVPFWLLLRDLVVTLGVVYNGIITPFTLAAVYGGLIVPMAEDMIVSDHNYISDFSDALKEGLLRKTWVPIGILVLSYVPASIPLILRLVLRTNELWSPTSVLLVVIYVISMSLVSQLASLAGGILFLEFEALEMEINVDSNSFCGLNKGRYRETKIEPSDAMVIKSEGNYNIPLVGCCSAAEMTASREFVKISPPTTTTKTT